MARKRIVLNEGPQRAFVKSKARAAAYVGGIGSGKTFSGIVKGLEKSQAPVPVGFSGPRGLIGASTEAVLKKVLLPQFFEIMEGTDLWKTGKKNTSWMKSELMARLIANCGCRDPHACDHEAIIFFASLNDPDELRGMELAWYHIDEGRNTTAYAWDVLWGRLRQQGYEHQGWVVSTSNGYDWMYDLFHEQSPRRLERAEMYTASSLSNVAHVGHDYIDALRARYHGKFFEQEVLGHFVGMTEGAVFFEWDPKVDVLDVPHRPDLPLYSEWDFGMADETVILFWQPDFVKWKPDGAKARSYLKPLKRYIGALEFKDTEAEAAAKLFFNYCDEHFNGRRPESNVGDPAGRQRHQSSGKSTVDILEAYGVNVTPAPQRPVDYAVNILNNLMADHRVLVDATHCERLAQALSSHRWPMDPNGTRKANRPVHDWTSHYCDAVRYGTTIHIAPYLSEEEAPRPHEYQPGTLGYITQQLLDADADTGEWLGQTGGPEIDWQLGFNIRARSA